MLRPADSARCFTLAFLLFAACDSATLAGDEELADLVRVSMTGTAPPGVETKPMLENWRSASNRLGELYPDELRQVERRRFALLRVLIDESGNVTRVEVQESSGSVAVDEAAIRFARSQRYTPAKQKGKPVRVWLEDVLVLWPLIVIDGVPHPELKGPWPEVPSDIVSVQLEPMPEIADWAGYKVIRITTESGGGHESQTG